MVQTLMFPEFDHAFCKKELPNAGKEALGASRIWGLDYGAPSNYKIRYAHHELAIVRFYKTYY